jgi:hypothetical protein
MLFRGVCRVGEDYTDSVNCCQRVPDIFFDRRKKARSKRARCYLEQALSSDWRAVSSPRLSPPYDLLIREL